MSINWKPVSQPPVAPGDPLSPLLLVRFQEFGQAPGYALARCWISTSHPLLPKFYLDHAAYNLLDPYQIAQQVTHYAIIDEPIEEG